MSAITIRKNRCGAGTGILSAPILFFIVSDFDSAVIGGDVRFSAVDITSADFNPVTPFKPMPKSRNPMAGQQDWKNKRKGGKR